MLATETAMSTRPEQERELARSFGLATARIFLVAWSISTLLLGLGMSWAWSKGFVTTDGSVLSIATNVSMVAATAVFYALNLRAANHSPDPIRFYRRTCVAILAFVGAGTLAHAHLAGSLSTVIVIGGMMVVIAAQRALGLREARVFYAVGLVGYLLLIVAACLGWVTYAPLYTHGERLVPVALRPVNAFAVFALYAVLSAIILAAMERSESDRRAALQALGASAEALRASEQEVAHLRSLVRMCASCKKICDEHGDWGDVERFIQDETSSMVSHGLCPTCMERLYPDYT